MTENIDNLTASYVRRWFEPPSSVTFSTLILPKSKYGINFILPSTKFLQCQTVLRNALKSSPNSDINSLWAKTSFRCNVQYDQYKNTKQVVTAIQKDNEGLFIFFIIVSKQIASSTIIYYLLLESCIIEDFNYT